MDSSFLDLMCLRLSILLSTSYLYILYLPLSRSPLSIFLFLSISFSLSFSLSISLAFSLSYSDGHLALERPLETALLLTLSGVRCVLLNQWHSSPQRNINNMDSVMESEFNTLLLMHITVCKLNTVSYKPKLGHDSFKFKV